MKRTVAGSIGTAGNGREQKAVALVSGLDRARGSRVAVEWDPRSSPCRAKTDEGHVVMAFRQCASERARLCFRAADRRKELLRDNDAHGVANLGERLADVSLNVSERSGVRLLDAVDHALPVPLFSQLRGPGLPHRRAKRRIVQQPLDRAGHIVGALADAEAIHSMGDHLAERGDIAADDGTLVQPRLEITDAEGLVQRRHREDVARVEGRRLFGAARALNVDDALVGVAREFIKEARVKPGNPDEHEPRVRMAPPDEFGGVEHVDVTLVPLLAPDVEDERSVRWNPVRHAERESVPRAQRIRAHARRDDPGRVDALAREDPPIVEGLRADHPDIVTPSRESRRELVRETLGSADACVRTLREKELHARAVRASRVLRRDGAFVQTDELRPGALAGAHVRGVQVLRCGRRPYRQTQERHACLSQGAAALAVVARLAGGDDVLPNMLTAPMARYHVIEGQVVPTPAAVLAGVIVPDEDFLTRHLDDRTRTLHVVGEADDRW